MSNFWIGSLVATKFFWIRGAELKSFGGVNGRLGNVFDEGEFMKFDFTLNMSRHIGKFWGYKEILIIWSKRKQAIFDEIKSHFLAIAISLLVLEEILIKNKVR